MAVDSRLLKQIQHQDPQQRRKAIVALADCRDLAGLKPLEKAAESDPEPKLRALAARAAKHLQEHLEQSAARASKPTEETAYKGEPEIRVSEKQMARGRGFMDEAMSMVVAKDNGKAAKALAKALKADPSLKSDTYFLSLAGNVFNTSGEEAIQKITSGQERGEFIKAQQQGKIQKRKDEHVAKTREIGWSSVAFDLIIYAAVIGIITFFAPMVYMQLVSRTAEYQAGLPIEKFEQEPVKISREFERAAIDFQEVEATALLIPAVINGVVSAGGMLVLGFVIHLLATKVMRGKGTLPFMLCQLVPFYSMMSPVFFIWSCIIMGMISIGAGLFGLMCVPIMSLAGLVVFFKAAGKIGTAYDFGAAKGCMSLVIASILLGVVSSLASMLLFNTAINSTLATLGMS
jgi:hypothetical protein